MILKGIINTGRGSMSGAKLDGGVEMIAACLDDLDLIADVLPDYALGRRRGLTDEETERRARAALTWAINRILEQGEKRLNHAREGEQDEDEKSDI